MKNTLVLRGSYIGRELANHTELLEWLISKNYTTISGFSNVIYSGISTVRIAKYLQILIEQNYGITGLYNVSSFPISKFDLLNILINKFNLKINIVRDTTYYSNKNLVSEKFFSLICKKQPNWD